MSRHSQLPLELWITILQQLLPNETGLRTLVCCALTSRLLYRATLSSSLWKPHYDVRYQLYDEANERSRRSRHGDDWRALYLERRCLDQEAISLLNAITRATDQQAIREVGEKLVKEFGLDLWETFKMKLSLPNPVLFQDGSDIDKIATGMPILDLSRRFWMSEILGVIARRRTMEIWGTIMKPGSSADTDIDAPFEEAFHCLSSFWNVHPLEIKSKIDELASKCREYLHREHIIYELDHDDLDIPRLCTSISTFLRGEDYHGAEEGQFYHIFNSFPNFFLFCRKGTLPISLAFIFVSLAKRLGLRAFPVSTPSRVVIWVEGTFVDAFVPPEHAILMTGDRRHADDRSYQGIGVPLAREMLARVGRNIITARDIAGDNQATRDHMCRATYAVDCIQSLYEMPANETHLSKFMTLAMQHPLDLPLVITDKLVPILSSDVADRFSVANSMYALNNPESTDSANDTNLPWMSDLHLRAKISPFFVGQLVVDESKSLGCIIGWTVTRKGRASNLSTAVGHTSIDVQTSYKILFLDGPALSRHAPNIQNGVPKHLIKAYEMHSTMDLRSLLTQNLLGFYFRDAERYEASNSGLERCRFIMNAMMMQLFPDDEEFGSRWVRSLDE